MTKLREQIVKITFILSIPIVIILGTVRLVATEPYLSYEYSKPGFPEDLFGFDRSMRIAHAADNIQFVTSKQSLDDLAGQKHNNSFLYNFRELKHMLDVKNTYQTTLQVWYLMLAVSAVSGIALIGRKEKRPGFASALRWGGALTVGLLIVIGLAAILAWQEWFVIFHRIFFALGSWTFDISDTLIRLFPEKFWYDTALTISGLSVIIGTLTYWMGSRLSKRYASRYEPSTLLGLAPSETQKNI
jgi:integral membrane protein (TIGR01906 family)